LRSPNRQDRRHVIQRLASQHDHSRSEGAQERADAGPQALVYVPGAVPDGVAIEGLQPLGVAGQAAHFSMVSVPHRSTAGAKAPTSVTLFDQGLVQVLEAAVTALEPKQPYVLALASHADASGVIEPLASFVTNTATPLQKSAFN